MKVETFYRLSVEDDKNYLVDDRNTALYDKIMVVFDESDIDHITEQSIDNAMIGSIDYPILFTSGAKAEYGKYYKDMVLPGIYRCIEDGEPIGLYEKNNFELVEEVAPDVGKD